jgi:hypothetical protein
MLLRRKWRSVQTILRSSTNWQQQIPRLRGTLYAARTRYRKHQTNITYFESCRVALAENRSQRTGRRDRGEIVEGIGYKKGLEGLRNVRMGDKTPRFLSAGANEIDDVSEGKSLKEATIKRILEVWRTERFGKT